ncbi:cytochrome c oxidase subunit 2A [Chitinophaga oryziterrae]|uniref:Cytochrome c oxidase subunit 2A n=1 Tax=Chitinophaga oryziterrae TaxID=1031224 RepID=A0A6N8JHC0_9BACT|nr:cytochrome c oxidase subunit 2A [Chitinophaga oryziterrae]MVT43552.1 cytochrome c oxidase subunit 2A [Chitinophaga oryziterrae]
MNTDTHSDIERDFKPKGTIVFIILLLMFTVLLWFSVYNLQLERH